MTASSVGGGNVVYQFTATGSSGQTVLQGYSANAGCTWNPAAGSYVLQVNAKDLDSVSQPVVSSQVVNYVITNALSGVSLTAVTQATGLASPGTVGSPVLITAIPTGGANVYFQYYVNGTLVQDFTTSTTFVWTPQQAQTDTLKVVAKDAYAVNPTQSFTSAPLSFVVAPDLSAVTLSASPASPRVVGTQITLTASATGGANVNYQFIVTGSNGNQVVQPYSASPTFVWTPQVADTYTLTVKACDLNGNNPNPTQSAVTSTPLPYVISPTISNLTLTSAQNPGTPWAIGTQINLTAKLIGGALPQYQFMANNTVIQAYSSSPNCVWTPSADGYYNVTVSVVDLNSAQPTQVTTSTPPLTFTITPALSLVSLNVTNLNVTAPSPSLVNIPLTLTATALGGAKVLYKFMANTTVLSDFSATASCTWTPTQAGTYTLTVLAEDQNSATPTQTLSTSLQYVITLPLTAVTLATNPSSPGAVNSPVTLTASNTGGANVAYKFVLTSGTTSKVLSDFSSAPTYQWVPTASGTFTLTAYAEDQAASPVNVVTSTPLTYVVKPALASIYVTVNPASTAPVGTSVTLTANCVGGASDQYQFWVYNPASIPAWSQVQAYSSQNTCTWIPNVPGVSLISATAQDAVNPGVEKNATLWYTVTCPALTAVSAACSPASPQTVSTPITLTATATGGLNVQYQFWVYNRAGNPAWSQVQAYSSQNSCTWTPTSAGSYLLSVTAKDGYTGTEVNQTYWYTVNPSPTALSAVSVNSSPASPQAVNTPISLTATATGGTNVQYQFWVYNPSGTPAWSQLQAYASLSTCTWKPTSAGPYLLSVTAKDGATGTEVNQTCWYTISTTNPLTAVNMTTTPASPQPAKTTIGLSATATGGSSVQFMFWVYNPGAATPWSQLQAYSAQSTCSWKPTTAGPYLLSVTARDVTTGTEVNQTFWYTIQ